MELPASQFYTGLVSRLYTPLRGTAPFDPAPYARFIERSGEPALELGCGDGSPLLDLRTVGLDVEGLDSSQDMLDRCQSEAARRGLMETTHCQPMESMDLGKRYRSVFLAGPTFNLLPDDATASAALGRIHDHLERGGSALIPFFVPDPTPPRYFGQPRVRQVADAQFSFTCLSEERDDATRTQKSLLRYEAAGPEGFEQLQRWWTLHWYTPAGSRTLIEDAGLKVVSTHGLDPDGQSQEWTHIARRPD